MEKEEKSPLENSKPKLSRSLGAARVQVFSKMRARGIYFTFRRMLIISCASHALVSLSFSLYLGILAFTLQNSENFKHRVVASA